MKTYNSSYALGRGFSRLRRHPKGWVDGAVVCAHGVVLVYSDGPGGSHSRLDFAHGGRIHLRSLWGKHISPRRLVTLARRFAAEISKPK